nr:MAG TPA: hypothetical protein [Caudoviricetes sp.]
MVSRAKGQLWKIQSVVYIVRLLLVNFIEMPIILQNSDYPLRISLPFVN